MSDGLLRDLPRDLPTFLKRFGTDAECRAYLARARWPKGFRCGACGHREAWSHKRQLIEECRSWGDASLRLPAINFVFSLAKRWILGTHHGTVRPKYLQRYLDEFVFRFNRRTAKTVSHGFARLIQHAVNTPPTTYRDIVHGANA